MTEETNEQTPAQPVNPLIHETSPADTLENCRSVLAFVGGRFVQERREGVDVLVDEAEGLWRVLEVVRAALEYEADQAPVTRAQARRAPVLASVTAGQQE